MKKQSAGLLLFRGSKSGLDVFLVHPGGPFWARKDAGAWSIPKGEYSGDEDALAAAKREFQEETSVAINGNFISLGEVKQASGKVVKARAVKHDLDPATLTSNTFKLEWPPRSGMIREFPEVDAWTWFSLSAARGKIINAQGEFLIRLANHLE
jgi:predicted NUDIX family NTP pyrophosphohydrolase